MTHHNALTTARCAAIFSDEITAAGGTIADSFDDLDVAARMEQIQTTLPEGLKVRTVYDRTRLVDATLEIGRASCRERVCESV